MRTRDQAITGRHPGKLRITKTLKQAKKAAYQANASAPLSPLGGRQTRLIRKRAADLA